MQDDQIRPASIVQVQKAWDDGVDIIEPDVGGVVEALQRHDPSLGVRLGKRDGGRAWVIFSKHCPAHPEYAHYCEDCRIGMSREFVTSRVAVMNNSGTWEGLTHEVVEAVCKVDKLGRSGYDFAAEVEKNQQEAEKARHEQNRAQVEEYGEELAHALRKDLNLTDHRAFISKKPEGL